MRTTIVTGQSKNTYKLYDFKVKDDHLKWSERYVDAINLSRFVGCFKVQQGKFLMNHMAKVAKIITTQEVDRYTHAFGFDYLVYLAMTTNDIEPFGEDEYNAYDWSEGLRGYVKYIEWMYRDDVEFRLFKEVVAAMGEDADL